MPAASIDDLRSQGTSHARKLRKALKRAHAGDAEGVHDSRTNVRRLRVDLEVLAGRVLDAKATARTLKHLSRLQSSLGKVRDTDVFVSGLAAYRQERPHTRRGTKNLLRALHARRRKSVRALRHSALSRKSRRGITQELHALLGRGQAAPRVGHREELRAFIRRALAREYAVAAARVPTDLRDEKALHRFRAACRSLRFAVELFAAGVPALDAIAKELHSVESEIGALHDHHVAAALIAKWRTRGKLRDNAELLRYRDWRAAEERSLRRVHERKWLQVLGASFPRRVQRALDASVS